MNEQLAGKKASDNVYLCPDGKYRWTYEFDMLRNPTLLFTIWKVLGSSLGIVFGIVMLIQLAGGGFHSGQELWNLIRVFLLLFLVIGVLLGGISYLIMAGIYGWKYIVLFTMDEKSIEHRHMKKQFDKAAALGWIAAWAGLAAGNAGTIGTGLLAATRDTSISTFQKVRKVKAVRRRHVIYVNQLFEHNQVYVEDSDFDFVKSYIMEHCPNAKAVL